MRGLPLHVSFATLSLGLVGALAPAASAHGHHRHDYDQVGSGAFIQADFGFGYGMMSAFDGVDMDGTALTLSGAIGTMASDFVGLEAAAWGSFILHPGVELGIFDATATGDATCAVGGAGPGVIVRVGPFWGSFAVGLSFGAVASPVVSDDFGKHETRSDGAGLGFRTALGGDLDVGERVGLGLGLAFTFASMPLHDEDMWGTFFGVGLVTDLTFD
ncbi:MAG: hypothetical protein U1F43_32095 [Myxococcota bacterium]